MLGFLMVIVFVGYCAVHLLGLFGGNPQADLEANKIESIAAACVALPDTQWEVLKGWDTTYCLYSISNSLRASTPGRKFRHRQIKTVKDLECRYCGDASSDSGDVLRCRGKTTSPRILKRKHVGISSTP